VEIFEPIIEALERNGVRYVVVGGVAVVLQGHPRFTADLDLVVDLEEREARKAIETLLEQGFEARVPVDPFGLADPEQRARWIAEKGMRVLSLYDPSDPMRVVDLFVEEPIPFDDLYERSEIMALGRTPVRVAAIEHLVHMKRVAGRPQDRLDIDDLEAILRLRDERDE